MKSRNNSPQGFKLKTGGAAVLLALGTLCAGQSALAATAAGVTLTNSVTVDYDDAGGTAQTQITANVSVTVDHLPSVAWGTPGADQSAASGEALPAAYTLTLTNTGNGADSYNITDGTTNTCTTGSLSAGTFNFTTPVALGGNVTSAAAILGATSITVPFDGAADAASRGIANGDTIVFSNHATVYTVSALSEVTPTTFTVTPALTAAVPVGTQVGERTTVNYGTAGSVVGNISGATPAGCEHNHSLTATGTTATGGNTQAAATQTDNGGGAGSWETQVTATTLTVAKYVRNVTTPAKNTGASDITYNGVAYHLTGDVSGNPGETLEYLVVITNSSAGDATDVEFNDTLPAFTTYTATSLSVDTNGDETFNILTTGLPLPNETEADSEGGIVTVSGSAIQVFAGTGGNENTNTGGGITDVGTAPNNKSAILYRVTID